MSADVVGRRSLLPAVEPSSVSRNVQFAKSEDVRSLGASRRKQQRRRRRQRGAAEVEGGAVESAPLSEFPRAASEFPMRSMREQEVVNDMVGKVQRLTSLPTLALETDWDAALPASSASEWAIGSLTGKPSNATLTRIARRHRVGAIQHDPQLDGWYTAHLGAKGDGRLAGVQAAAELAEAEDRARIRAEILAGQETVSKLTQTQVAIFKGAFDKWDSNGDGTINADELGEVLSSIQIETSDDELAKLLTSLDTDGGGSIGLTEFISGAPATGDTPPPLPPNQQRSHIILTASPAPGIPLFLQDDRLRSALTDGEQAAMWLVQHEHLAGRQLRSRERQKKLKGRLVHRKNTMKHLHSKVSLWHGLTIRSNHLGRQVAELHVFPVARISICVVSWTPSHSCSGSLYLASAQRRAMCDSVPLSSPRLSLGITDRAAEGGQQARAGEGGGEGEAIPDPRGASTGCRRG